MNWYLEIAGENSLIVYIDSDDRLGSNRLIGTLINSLQVNSTPWLLDYIPSYASLLLVYDPSTTDHFKVRELLSDTMTQAIKGLENNTASGSQTRCLPVWYGGGEANDLARVSALTGLSSEEVIARHTSGCYRVFAVGFSPGFAFMGDLDEGIRVPRLDTPRLKVPQGAVGITGAQTAVYPTSSPGGWNLIGLCPIPLFDFDTARSVLQIGDEVRFTPISEQVYQEYLQK